MKRAFIFLGLALVLVSGCKRSGLDIDSEPRALSVESISLVESAEWGTKSALQDTTVVDLGDSVMMTCDLGFIGDEALTKGTPMESASNISTFKIKVFNTGASNWSTSSTVTADITATKSGSSFNCSPSYNWKSETDKVTLMSYAPLAGGTTGLSEYNNYTIQYIVPTDVANHPDFCATNAETNLVNDDGTKHMRNFGMSHKLAAVGFALNGWNVKITKVEITGVCFYGRYDMNTGAWTQVETLGSRTGGVNGATVNNSYSSNKTWTNATSNNGYMMMIPQTLSANSKAIITYTATGGTATSGTITAPLNGLTGGKWTAGQKVTYNIQLKMAPSTSTTELTMIHRAGYTTNPVVFINKDPDDKYTFTWDADWMYVHEGNPKVNNADGGSGSGWGKSANVIGHVRFFSKTYNTSNSTRTAVVTMTGKRTGTKTFVVKQEAGDEGWIHNDVLKAAGWPVDRLPKEGALQVAKRGYQVLPSGVAGTEDPKIQWKTSGTTTSGVELIDDFEKAQFGMGQGSTSAMIAAGASAHPAAKYCREMGAGWYLPSIKELKLIYDNRALLGPSYKFNGVFYRSVSDNGSANWGVYFNNGSIAAGSKNYNGYPVRCVKGTIPTPTISLNTTEGNIPYSGNSLSINVTSNTTWSVSTTAGSVTFTPSSGKGETTVRINVLQNPKDPLRSFPVVFTATLAGSATTATWTGHQMGNPYSDGSYIPTAVIRAGEWSSFPRSKGLQVAMKGNVIPGGKALADDIIIQWCSEPGVTYRGNHEDVGTGANNYNRIKRDSQVALFPISKACGHLGPEWYIPSSRELYAVIYRNRGYLKGDYEFYSGGDGYYWSNTNEVGGYHVWVMGFHNGKFTDEGKTTREYRTRCVREID